MDAVAGTASRIQEIQARLDSLAAPAAGRVAARGESFARALSAASGSAGSASGAASTAVHPAVGGQLAAASAAWNRTVSSGASAGLSGPGRLTAAGVPVELAGYGNGKVPAAALQTIGHGSHRLWAPAATAYRALEAAAARDGVHLGVTDSYRSYDSQVELAQRKGLYSQGGLAARPGTSEHGWGRSLDLDLDREAQSWMRTRAAQYGYRENVAREPWHWTFTPGA